jgi:citrate lyase alpha subunit
MIDRILFHIYSNDLFNDNQYGFNPQTGTTDAVMGVKKFIEESLRLKHCTVMVSLDVKGASDAAWWPSILQKLRELKCPKNLYDLSVSYFSNRKATSLLRRRKKSKRDVHRDLAVAQAFGMLCIIHF